MAKVTKEEQNKNNENNENTPYTCLRNERVNVKFIPKQKGMITNPRHVLYGGMAEGVNRTFVVPRLKSGTYVNILTNDEKNFLEHIMGLEDDALSVYNKVNNYWDDTNQQGVSKVSLTKGDNFFDMSDPEDYIRVKILLAWKDIVAPSLQYMEDHPKPTYQFVLISEGDESKTERNKMNNTMRCYKEYGKVEDDFAVLRFLVESLMGRPTSPTVKIEWLQSKINELIQADAKLFLKTITDPLLENKVLIKKAVEKGIIANRDNHYYLREDNSPLCESNEESTLTVAAKYISAPKRQDLLLSIQAKIKE